MMSKCASEISVIERTLIAMKFACKGKRFRHTWRHLLIVLALAGSSSALAQVPADPFNYSRTSSFTYDPATGLLLTEKLESGASGVVTTHQYDVYGNKKSSSTANDVGASGNAVFATRTSTVVYGSVTFESHGLTAVINAGAFPTRVSNALQQSEARDFDPRFGTILRVQGPNKLPTTWAVDDFGRTVLESRADGTSTMTAYCFISGRVSDLSSNSSTCPVPGAAEVPAKAVKFTHAEPRNTAGAKNGPFSRSYVDGMGRTVRTVTEAFDSAVPANPVARLIVQDTDYSPQGNVLVSTQPYFLDSGSSITGGGHYGMSTTEYDVLGRPAATYSTDIKGSQNAAFGERGSFPAAVTKNFYDGLKTTTVNDKGQGRAEEKNVNGKLIRVTDAVGAQIAYQYDAFDNLVQTKDALQNVVKMTYDIRGRKTSMNDPDTGLWEYDYNALGELVWQRNANQRASGQATTMRYDLLGRQITRVDPEYTSNWYFDAYADGSACNKGVGKLCESRTTHGVYRKYFYDNLGRALSNRTDLVNSLSFASSISYDSVNGWPVSQTYPTGLTVNLQYKNGFLSGMTLATAATVNPLPATPGGAAGAATTLAAGSLLWSADSYNAWGKLERQTFGNNVVNSRAFDALTGRVSGTTAGIDNATSVMNYSYVWDSLSHLMGRADANGDGSTGAVTDNFIYDDVGRLKTYTVAAPSIPGLQRTVTMDYNVLGMLINKSDVGAYNYQAQGAGVAQPHALQSVTGAFNSTYLYDANGNLKTSSGGAYRNISYTSFNLPDADIQSGGLAGAAGGPRYAWQYDENRQRIKETQVVSGATRTTWTLHPDNAGGLSFEYEERPNGVASRHYLTAGGTVIGVLVAATGPQNMAASQTAPTTLFSIRLNKVEYWHKDHLGSLVTTTDHTGAPTQRYAYDPFGKRRTVAGVYDASGTLVYDWSSTSSGTDRGYTGHEHLDDVGVIHMNGRLFDPRLGMFMQGDNFVQDPSNLQNFNRYGYCYNNPMTCTDPSGHLFGGMFRVPVIDNLWNNHIKQYVPMIAAITISIYFPEALTYLNIENGLAQAAITGFASGAVSSGNLKGGIQGMFTASLFYGAGSAIPELSYMNEAGTITDIGRFAGAIALHGVVGCVSSVASGNKCGPGALSAAFSKAALPYTASLGEGNLVTATVVSAVVGGTASVLGGGKFANGATTGAFSYLYNHWAHWMELAAYGREAHQLLQAEMSGLGYTVERKCMLGNCVNGRFDIGSAPTLEVWEIKRNSKYGLAMGEIALDAYTTDTGLRRGGDLIGLKVGGEMSIWTGNIEYHYNNYGGGLIGYTRNDHSPKVQVPMLVPFPILKKKDDFDNPGLQY